MLSSPRRLALSWGGVRRCWVRCLIRSVRSAIWISGEPVSLVSRRYAEITSALLGRVADGTRCPFLDPLDLLFVCESTGYGPISRALGAAVRGPQHLRRACAGPFRWRSASGPRSLQVAR